MRTICTACSAAAARCPQQLNKQQLNRQQAAATPLQSLRRHHLFAAASPARPELAAPSAAQDDAAEGGASPQADFRSGDASFQPEQSASGEQTGSEAQQHQVPPPEAAAALDAGASATSSSRLLAPLLALWAMLRRLWHTISTVLALLPAFARQRRLVRLKSVRAQASNLKRTCAGWNRKMSWTIAG